MAADVKRKGGERTGEEGAGLETVFGALEQRVESLSAGVREQAAENARLKAALEEASAQRERLRTELADAAAAAGSSAGASEKLSRLETERTALRVRIERLIGLLEAPESGSGSGAA